LKSLSKAVSAKQMAREVEEGINHYTTEIRKKSNEISDDIMRLTENSSNISLCFTLELPRLNETKFFDLYSGVLQNYRKKGMTMKIAVVGIQ
jgi:hypothetical protein